MNPDPNVSPAETAHADRLHDLVADALDLPSGERVAFLTKACRDDASLLVEARALVGYDQSESMFLGQPAYMQVAGEGLGGIEADSLAPGTMLGENRLHSLLGEGGMGEVYLAEDTKLERRVAVKLLKRSLDDASLARRFRHERKVLAGLTHPNIARLYGGATTPEGQSYLVMEYVEGERLDGYCDNHRLGISERLVLFRKICAAVSYAHQNLVVHRDLKPANIRVTPEGEPKLLDFGIAKLLETEATAPGPNPTLTMQAMMTPEYASPEQLRGEGITTASDVYSLGVVLYELLTGQRPYTISSRRPDELARAICEQEPARPSTVAGRGLRTETEMTTGRGTPPQLRRRLEGDLDNIVAMALRKEPARRYTSVGQFSEDLRRHAEGLPVIARKDTVGYRVGKFIRRNKTGTLAAALVTVALVGGLTATTWQARVARQERDRARVALANSELAEKQSEQLNGFLQTLLGSANPDDGPGRDLRVVQVLDQASTKLDRELAGEPALLAQAHLTIGQAYAGLREANPCLTHLRAALEIDRRIYGEENLVTARVKAVLGAAMIDLLRTYADAEPLLRQALAVERRQPPGERRMLPQLLRYDGKALSQLGRMDDAKAMAEESLALVRSKEGEQGVAYANALSQLASLSISQEDYVSAEAPLRQSAAIHRRLRPHTPLLAGVLTSLAYDLMLEGKLDEPEGILREAQELYRGTVGEESIAYNMDLGCLSWLHFLRGEYAQAEAELRVCHAYARKVQVPEGEQDYVGGKVLLALAITRQGRPSEAEPALRRCLELAKKNNLQGNALPEIVAGALGECLLAENRYAEAEPLLLADYDHLRRSAGDKIPRITDPVHRLHDLYIAWNKPSETPRFAPGEEHEDGGRH